jgi:hypothetical protein
MAEDKETLVADMHTKAAYAHTAAAFSHSTGDHASGQDLAKKALEDSVEAVKYSDSIADDAPRAIRL